MENDRTASYDMRIYVGTNTVRATRMNAAGARRAGANVPDKYFGVCNADYNPGADGYLVIYADGYRSWSPAKAFEESYKVADTPGDRMKIELSDLNERICEATRAINTFEAIPIYERDYLQQQVRVMQKYADILYERIRCAVEPRAAVSSEPSCCSAATTKEGR